MIIMSVDLGRVRTGLAVCDRDQRLASPLTVVTHRDPEGMAQKIAEAAGAAGAQLLVVGLPRNMDGSEGESARLAREMGSRLGELTGLPVEFWDERGTTITAHNYLNDTNTRGKKRKAAVDAVAATVILDDYLRWRRNQEG